MRIGFLHVGPPEGGVCRYGLMLAAEAKRRSALQVEEAFVGEAADVTTDPLAIRDAARRLSSADVVHLQYSRHAWGTRGSWLREFLEHCRCPIVATFHDVYVRRPRSSGPAPRRWASEFVGRITRDRYADNRRAAQRLLDKAAVVLVSSHEEAQRLAALRPTNAVRVLPHFVERRSLATSREAARKMLDLDDRRVVTLLGFIHGRKGHRMALDALARLPKDVVLIFAGRAPEGGEAFVDELLQQSRRLDVADRLHVTGYLDDDELDKYLVATDLAICPFEQLSASGSLSTWIAAGRPILAADLPQFDDYNRLEPGAVRTFAPYDADALAGAIHVALGRGDDSTPPAIVALQERLSMPSVFDRHLDLYRLASGASDRCHAAFLPWYGGNPYQRQYADHLLKHGVRVEGIDQSIASLLRLPFRSAPDVLHLHWLHPFCQSPGVVESICRMVLFLIGVTVLRLRGTRLVWTVHNLRSHETRHPRLDRVCSTFIARRAAAIHVHCQTAQRAVRRAFALANTNRIFVLPHGHFINSYENRIGQLAAREKLGLSADETVFLFLGHIRPYKGVLDLIGAFDRIDDPNARLLIAGKTAPPEAEGVIRDAIRGPSKIDFRPGFVADDSIQVYLNACDLVVLPYRDILTSGAAVLAMSFGKACVAPRLGCLPDVLDADGGFLYDARHADGLADAIKEAATAKGDLPRMGEHNRELAKGWDWNDIARATADIYTRVIDTKG